MNMRRRDLAARPDKVGHVRRDLPDVTVIGAGVVGLTTAVCLAEAGLAVAVHAAEPPLQTTSLAAGAIWGPHLVGPPERVARWAARTLATLHELTAAGHAFVRLTPGIAASRLADTAPPEFAAGAADLSPCPPADLPPGYLTAWRLSAPLVTMPEYLSWLHERYLSAGGRPITVMRYPTLADAIRGAATRVIVNCTGCGARELVPDPQVVPVRGQAVVVANPGISTFFAGTGPGRRLTYYFPHRDRIVLGGTEQPGDWNREPDHRIASQIIAACTAIEPALHGAAVLEHRVGLRPVRPEVRLESVQARDGVTVVHNYGHGGAGVTLSWGCAAEAAGLVQDALR
jgi:D-amino-acid oxidase